jgi:hypothetical protein
MRSKIAFFLGASVAILCAAVLAGQLAAEEGTPAREGSPQAGDSKVSCTEWMNCDEQSPNYTGFCCRCCTFRSGYKQWECRETLAEGERRDALLAANSPAGEAKLAGIVTRQGLLEADDGHAYAVAGAKAEELASRMGRRIEVKGRVQEVQGRVAIDVEAYELVRPGPSGAGDAFGSCTTWKNCNSKPPTFTGTCCRQCEDEEGRKLWDCKVVSPDEYFDLAEWVD